MLKWLSAQRRHPTTNVLTDDPLATITVDSKNTQVYSVSRVNPIFVEEESCGRKPEEDKVGHSGSSGYESHRSSRSGRRPLRTIPEWKVDYAIPRPVWPRSEEAKIPHPVVPGVHGYSSCGSSSGFSEPAVSPAPSRLPVFLGDPPPSALNKNMLYGSLQSRASQTYAKVSDLAPVETAKEAEFNPNYQGYRDLDFTLDGLQAEQLIKKLKSRKQQRCWCRVITSFMGLLLFLFSVIIASMLLTRGKRMFGSL